MLRRVDRMLLAVRDREAAADTFRRILGAERVREDTSRLLVARRTVVQAGLSEFDLLEPAGEGPVLAHLERWDEGILAVGFSAADLSALASRLSQRGVSYSEEDGRLWIASDQTPGMNIVLSPDEERSPVGLIKWLYEVTNIVDDHQRAAAFYADAFGLDSANFSPIHSDRYGYTGQLLLFNPPQQLELGETGLHHRPPRSQQPAGVLAHPFGAQDTAEGVGRRLAVAHRQEHPVNACEHAAASFCASAGRPAAEPRGLHYTPLAQRAGSVPPVDALLWFWCQTPA